MSEAGRQLRVLGPLELYAGGRVVALGSAPQRRLLARLAIDQGVVVSADRLGDDLELSPAALRTAISRLRRVVGADALDTVAPGYRMTVSTDVQRFEDLLAAARSAAAALLDSLLGQALALWRGPMLPEFAHDHWALPIVTRLSEMRASAVEDRAELQITEGRFGQAIADLERHTKELPLRDRPRSLLMQALADSGRRVEALRVFQEYRSYLAEETGLEPSVSLRTVERRIASEPVASGHQAASIDAATRRPPPTGVVTFLFSDVEGSTRLWARHPNDMRRALARHDEIMRHEIRANDGHIFATAGDSFGAAFQKPLAAVQVAAAVQRALTSEPWPSTTPIKVRVGIHIGTADERDGNYFGATVNLAARVQAAGHGGQILLTETVGQQLGEAARLDANNPPVLRDLGEYRLRDIEDPLRLFQVDVEGLMADFPALRSGRTALTNLPTPRTVLVGREDAIAEVRHLLAAHRLVTLTGSGGIGKTRLAVEAAAAEAATGSGDVVFVDLSSTRIQDEVTSPFFASLSLAPAGSESLGKQLTQALASRQLLLVVDNCEHVLESAAVLIDELLDGCPFLTVLATSRGALGVPGEHRWRVPSLPVRPGSAALQLFVARARDVDAGFAFASDDEAAAVEICRRLDGVPLAIELATAHVATMALNDILVGLDDRFRFLRAPRRSVSSRQQTLETTIAWGWAILSAEERQTMRSVAVFRDGFLRTDAVGVSHFEEWRSGSLLDSLVDKCLIDTIRKPGDPRLVRYRIPESIREYARQQLVAAGELDGAEDRHLEQFLRTDGAPPDIHVLDVARRVHVRDFDNLRAAADRAMTTGRPRAATQLMLGRTVTIVERGAAREGLAWLEGRDELGVADQLWALNGCAYLAMSLGEQDRADAYLEQLFGLAGSGAYEAMPNAFGFAATNRLSSDVDEALELINRGVAIVAATPSGEAHVPFVRAMRSLVFLHLGRWAEALADCDVVFATTPPESPFRGRARGTQLLALAAQGDHEHFARVLSAVDRPAHTHSHEWNYRLFDWLTTPAEVPEQRTSLAESALVGRGGNPVERAQNVLAVYAWRRLQAGEASPETDQLASLGVSSDAFGALAIETLGRLRGWTEWQRSGCHDEVARASRSAESRQAALHSVEAMLRG